MARNKETKELENVTALIQGCIVIKGLVVAVLED